MPYFWLGLAVVGAAAYHVVLKLTPIGVNPYLSLAVTYAVVTLVFAGAYLVLPGPTTARVAIGQLNWTALVLGLVVVFLDLAFLMMYRGGFDVSLGQIVSQSGTALLLLLIGVAFFSEKISVAKVAGIALCIVGLWLISKKD
jgi:uncharacterized membrane protein